MPVEIARSPVFTLSTSGVGVADNYTSTPFVGGSTQLLDVLANDTVTSGVITVLTQPAAGSATATGGQIQVICGTPVSATQYSFTYSVDGSAATTVTYMVSGQGASGQVNLGTLQVFTPAQVQLTTLPGWPAGRTPASMVLQGACAYGYVRRSWKPNRNDGTWLDVMPGWQPTAAQETMKLQLDNGTQIDVGYTVAGTIPSPQGGTTRYLDSTGGGNYTTWQQAIQSLSSGDVLVVRARAGSRNINGRQIPYSTYPADVGDSGTAASTATNVTIYADPTDLAAGRRPRVHINGSDLAGFYDDPNGMWQVDNSSANTWSSVRNTYPAPSTSVNAFYRTPTGRVCGLYDYFVPGNSWLNQLRDTTYPKFDQYYYRTDSSSGAPCYTGPGITWNGGRYYVRLERPAPSTVTKGAFSGDPWYWGNYFPPSLNPNLVPLWVGTTASTTSCNSCLNINGTSGWKIYNLDFVPGGIGIRADNTTNFQIYGCRFFGVCCVEQYTGDHQSYEGKSISINNASGVLVDRCEIYGGWTPWMTWSEGKGWAGEQGHSCRNGAFWTQNTNFTARHSHFEGYLTMIWQNGAQNGQMRWHHCTWYNAGNDGSLCIAVPSSATIELSRSRIINSTLSGWSGGPTSGSQNSVTHYVSNLEVRLVPGYASHRAMYVKRSGGGPPSSLDCDYVPAPDGQPHGGQGGIGLPKMFCFQNSKLGTQRHRNSGIAPGFGTGATLVPHNGWMYPSYNIPLWSQNNICAVYPSHNGYIWQTSDPAVDARDSFAAYHLFDADGVCHLDYNHLYRHPSMPNTGHSGLSLVVNGDNNAVTDCSNIAAIQANSPHEDHGTSGDPGWSITYPGSTADSLLYAKSNYLINTGTTQGTGGNTGLAGQGAHDWDINTQITYPGYSWRGCMVPGVPAIEQEVGQMGPTVTPELATT